jgi:uncharacterized protein
VETRSYQPGVPCWTDLLTPNLGVAREFYGEVFDWTFEVGGPETGGYTMCRLGDRTVAGLGLLPPQTSFPTAWQIYFASGNVTETVASARQAGARVLMEPTEILTLGSVAICCDSTGALVGVWQAGRHVGIEQMHAPGAFTWCEINTRDRVAAEAFYRSVFGLTAHRVEGLDYSVLCCPEMPGGPPLCGVLQMTPEWGNMNSHWMVYFATNNTDGAAKRVQEAGGRLCYQPFDTPRGRVAIAEDPMGAVFCMVQQPR